MSPHLLKTLNQKILYILALGLFISGCNIDVETCVADQCLEAITVETSKGKLAGVVQDDVQRFYHIPYAKPPVGNLRWQPPQTVEAWSGTKVAHWSYRGCTQWAKPTAIPDLAAQEDCLYLNVWAPNKAGPHPVMVFIHGGGFLLGSGTEPSNNAEKLAKFEDVIVVNMNYRMGVFGFLALPELATESAYNGSGNYGLLDQQMALQWVNDEIANFGGDPNNITLFGESAGGFSTCMHMASPMSRDLFDHAIIQSGPCTSWGIIDKAEAEQNGTDFAALLGCSTPATRLSCMRAKSEAQIKEVLDIQTNELFKATSANWAFFPQAVQDNHFLPDTFDNLLSASTNQQNVIIGVVENEGSLFEVYKDHPDKSEYLSYLTQRYPGQETELNTHYPIGDFNTTGDAIAQIAGDELITCPTVELSDRLATLGYPVYQYVFAEFTESILRTMSIAQQGTNPPALGTFHSGEMPFVFGQSGPTATIESPSQWGVVGAVQGYFANLAATGDPNDASLENWPSYETANKRYLTLAQGFAEETALNASRCNYWNNL